MPNESAKEGNAFIISNTETFNKFLLTISSASFPVFWFMIKEGTAWILGLKISLGLFVSTLIITMIALFIASDYPGEAWAEKVIDWLDYVSFGSFILALVLACCSILQI
jgi:hypothetical protein